MAEANRISSFAGDFARKLLDFGRTHSDFMPILNKYRHQSRRTHEHAAHHADGTNDSPPSGNEEIGRFSSRASRQCPVGDFRSARKTKVRVWRAGNPALRAFGMRERVFAMNHQVADVWDPSERVGKDKH